MILSDFPVFLGVKWLKFDCKVTTQTTFDRHAQPPININFYRTENSNHQVICYTDYIFSEQTGFTGTNSHKIRGDQLTGYYYVDSEDVVEYANPTYSENQGGQYTRYDCIWIAHATRRTTTIYSKGGTGYGAVYADKDELPADGQLIEGSASDAYCVIRTGGNYYYYEKSI